jgi:hypothetical protein
MRGIYTSYYRKLAVCKRVPEYSGYMSGYSGHWVPDTSDSVEFTDGEQLPGDSGHMFGYSGHLYSGIPDQYPDTLGSAGDFTRRLFIVVGLTLMVFCRFS